jgi:hypothetical protein
MKRLSGVIAALTFGALGLVGAAGATKPYMERQAFGPVTFAAGEMCSFPVLIQPTAPDVLNVIIFSNDKFFSSGPVVATATNLDSGKSIKINISGTVSFVPHKDGSATLTFNGPTLSVSEGVISYGRLVLQFDATGNLTSSSLVGKQTDLCAELAGP